MYIYKKVLRGADLFVIKIADLKIAIDNKYDFVYNICKNYIVDDVDYSFKVSVSVEEMEAERIASGTNNPDGYIESVCIYRNIALELPKYNAFVIHCAAIEVDGDAYCFAARSGTGKTTHIKLWRRTFGEKVHVINGDKPIMRFYDDKILVCGTPWGGKENLSSNVMIPLKSVCFIYQNPDNTIKRITPHEALGKLLKQVFIPKSTDDASKTIDLIGKMLERIPMWSLGCNISQEAALTSYNAMKN